MKDAASIHAWVGCDPQIEDAISAFEQSWGPYSAKSRRHSIFRLLRELIDPAWFSFCQRWPELNGEELNRSWNQYQDERVLRGLAHNQDIDKTGTYPLSVIAHYLGFDELDWFIRAIARNALEIDGHVDVLPTLDSLRDLAIRCRSKKPKRVSGRQISLSPSETKCRFCNQPTQLAEYALCEARLECVDDPGHISRLSALYCAAHRPKTSFSNRVEAVYLREKRNQGKVERELQRLDLQSWAGSTIACAKSGNSLVDEFVWRLSVHRCLTYEQQPIDEHDLLESRLWQEARRLVSHQITDRKKEIIALLSSGISQAQAAKRLGLKSRQAISKALQSVPAHYRLDLLSKISHSSMQ